MTGMELNTVYNEDCLETMSRMSDGFIDLVVTSPPYNMNLRVRNNEYVSRQIVKEFSTKYNGFDDNLPIDEFYTLHKRILSELVRVSSLTFYNFQIVTGSKEAYFKLMGDFASHIKDVIVWDKGAGQPAMHPNVMNACHELILVITGDNTKGRAIKQSKFERGTMPNLWRHSSSGIALNNHGAVFPLSLVKKAIANFSNAGDLVYDPFMGSGTTARACVDLHRNYIGSELSAEYCEMTEKRLRQLILI